MSYAQNPYQNQLGDFAALAAADDRAAFITKTYVHLAGAIAVFAGLEAVIVSSGIGDSMLGIPGDLSFRMAAVLGAFMLVSTLATNWAVSASSPGCNMPAWDFTCWRKRSYSPRC